MTAQPYDELVPFHHLNLDPKLSSLFESFQWNKSMADEVLRASISESGVVNPVIVWRQNMVIVDGHRRARACERLGIPVPVRYMDFESLEQAVRFAYELQASRRNVRPEDHLGLAEGWKKMLADANRPASSPINESLRMAAEEAGMDWSEVRRRAANMTLVDQMIMANRIRRAAEKARQVVEKRGKKEEDKPLEVPSVEEAAKPLDRVRRADKRIRKLVHEATICMENIQGVFRKMGAENWADDIDDDWVELVDKVLSRCPVCVCTSHDGSECQRCGGKGWLSRGEIHEKRQ